MVLGRRLGRGAAPVGLGIALALGVSGPPAEAPALREVIILGTEYAYVAPAMVEPGLTAFVFENRGQIRHELTVARLKAGVTLDSIAKAPAALRRALVEPGTGGILVADPGVRTTTRLLIDLRPSQAYVLICTLRDAPGGVDGPPHFALGMTGSFLVR